jgi:hypothetical protein
MWQLINECEAQAYFTHYLFRDGDRVAIADHSIRDLRDPSSTDDGLLLIDPEGTVRVHRFAGNLTATIRVFDDRGRRQSVPTSLLTVVRAGLPLPIHPGDARGEDA